MTIRTFIAIKIPVEVKEQLKAAQALLNRNFRAVSWARPESIHLTLKFLGEIDDTRTVEVGAALEEAARGVNPFSLTVEGVGGFPTPAHPRVIWAGINENPELSRLQDNIEKGLSHIGFETEERPFSPHLTLCRIKSPADSRGLSRLLAEVKPQIKAEFGVSSFTLFKSVLHAKGAEYSALREITLKG